jgi:hypothetical protein
VKRNLLPVPHATAQSTPIHLVFGRDAALSMQHEANWQHVKERIMAIALGVISCFHFSSLVFQQQGAFVGIVCALAMDQTVLV